MSDAETPDDARVTLEDDELALTDKRRIRQLFDAREEAADALREAPMNRHELRERTQGKPIDPELILREVVASAVKTYALEADALFRRTDTGWGYWTDTTLPVWTLNPSPQVHERPPGYRDRPGHKRRKSSNWEVDIEIADTGELPTNGTTVRLEGVRDFVHLSVPTRVAVDVRWELELRSATNTETTTRTVDVAPPVEVSETVFRCVNDLLADVGIGLEAEVTDDDPDWDYSDLV